MFLSQAAKTGRKFHRLSEAEQWYYLEGKKILKYGAFGCHDDAVIDAEMLVALDWEPQPKLIEVSAKALLEVAKNLSTHPIVNQRRLAPVEFMKLVIEELGLKEEE